MGTIIALGMFAVTASASPWVAAFMNHKLEAQRRKWALARLGSDPLIYEGAELRELQSPDRDRPILSHCVITDISLGRVEFQEFKSGDKLGLTVRECEGLIFIMKDADADAAA